MKFTLKFKRPLKVRVESLVGIFPKRLKSRKEILEQIEFMEAEYDQRKRQLEITNPSELKRKITYDAMSRYAAKRLVLRWVLGLED